MGQRRRLYVIGLLAVLLPCVVIGLIGYRWLRLEGESEARRSQDAAEVEVTRIRGSLAGYLSNVAGQVARQWTQRAAGGAPLVPPPPLPDVIESAYLFESDGNLLYPNYQGAYDEAVREFRSASERPEWQRAIARVETLEAQGNNAGAQQALRGVLSSASKTGLRAQVLLGLGRVALAAKQYPAAESFAVQTLECCAASRDEYGVSFAVYAAAQLAATWEAQGQLRARFPRLASRLGELLQKGVIGHPKDVEDVSAVTRRVSDDRSASALLDRAEQAAARIRREIETGERLERWLAGFQSRVHGPAPLSLSTYWSDGRPQLASVCRAGNAGVLAVLFNSERLGAWIARWSAEEGHFDAALVRHGENQPNVAVRAALSPEAPGLDLVLWQRTADPVARQRQTLFAAALAAALVAILLVVYFAHRDVSRELKLSALRSNFVAGVTHELKTPLTSIRLLAETLRLKRAPEPRTADELLGALIDESERLAQLVENVLSFARIERGATTYYPAEIQLSEAVNSAVRRFQSILNQGDFRLVQEVNPEGLRVYADAEGLSLALLNLLSNAVKYSGRSREIRLEVHRRGKEAEIRMTDYGIGIPPSEQQQIFDSFYRAPEAPKESTGAGLGLALVRHFAQAHRGRVTVRSQPGKGSVFSLWLPLMKDHGEDSHR